MVKITPENITQQEILGLLEVLSVHRDILTKINPKEIGFVKRALFTKYVSKVNKLYEELDNKK